MMTLPSGKDDNIGGESNQGGSIPPQAGRRPGGAVAVYCPTDEEGVPYAVVDAGSVDVEHAIAKVYPTKGDKKVFYPTKEECYKGGGGQEPPDGKFIEGGKGIDPMAVGVLTKRDYFMAWMGLLTLIFLSLFAYGFASGLFIPDPTSSNAGTPSSSSESNKADMKDRQEYYDTLLTFLDLPFLEPDSPQALAMEWLAFEDERLEAVLAAEGPDNAAAAPRDDGNGNGHVGDRVKQRYALVTWYFAQGGPKLWTTVNIDPSAGWINFGAGVHECKWTGIDCEHFGGQGEADADDAEEKVQSVVVAVRLSPSVGVVLTGTSLSTEIGMLTHLKRLDLSGQRLEGSIPDEWMALTNIEMLSLADNRLFSTIPSWIDKWKNLTSLALDGNDFSGSLPPSFLTLSTLRHLELQGNINLNGRIDEVLIELTELEHFDVSGTAMKGTIPSEVELTNLRLFQVMNAKLSGSIPTEVGTWTNLETFTLEFVNFLTGAIPTEMGLMTNMQSLHIKEAANLSGTLPTELGLMTNLTSMVLSFTNREGTLPVEYSNLTKLATLDLFNNKGLTGSLPTEYSQLVNLRYMDLRKTLITGDVRPEICAIGIDDIRVDCYGGANAQLVCVCCDFCEGR